MTGLSDKILNDIKTQKVSQRPAWIFRSSELLKLLFLGVTLVAGAFAVSAVIFLLADYEWDVGLYQNGDLPQFILRGIPFYLIIVVIVLGVAAAVDFFRTKTGYRHGTAAVVAVYVGFLAVFGTALYLYGFGDYVDDVFSRLAPGYEAATWHRDEIWSEPELGLLGATVVGRLGPLEFAARDFHGNAWDIRVTPEAAARLPDLTPGRPLRIIGRVRDEGMFDAKDVRPWDGHHGFRRPLDFLPSHRPSPDQSQKLRS